MAKIKTSFSLSSESINLLKLLSEKNNRSQANMLEILIKERCEKEKIKYAKT